MANVAALAEPKTAPQNGTQKKSAKKATKKSYYVPVAQRAETGPKGGPKKKQGKLGGWGGVRRKGEWAGKKGADGKMHYAPVKVSPLKGRKQTKSWDRTPPAKRQQQLVSVNFHVTEGTYFAKVTEVENGFNMRFTAVPNMD